MSEKIPPITETQRLRIEARGLAMEIIDRLRKMKLPYGQRKKIQEQLTQAIRIAEIEAGDGILT